MPLKEITLSISNKGSRNEVRMRVVDILSKEEAGKGKGDKASKYIYYVETLKDGNRIYLQRPAHLYNGFDFLVCVENTNYAISGEKKRNYPSHDDIEFDLEKKRIENPLMYEKLFKLIKRVFECDDITDSDYSDISFSSGLSAEHILKVIKWLFIEQDIRYWNYSGRYMTWGVVPEP